MPSKIIDEIKFMYYVFLGKAENIFNSKIVASLTSNKNLINISLRPKFTYGACKYFPKTKVFNIKTKEHISIKGY